MNKQIITTGTRKKSVARATLNKGTGIVKINNVPLQEFTQKLQSLKLQEPLILAEKSATEVDIKVKVEGGGINSQAEAARLAIAKALVKHNKKLEKIFADYDRHLLVADVRYKETRKPNSHGKARAKVQKSYR